MSPLIADEHDCGQVRAGEKVEHRFKITNTSAADLNITDVRTNCGCAVAGEYPPSVNSGSKRPQSLETQSGKAYRLTRTVDPRTIPLPFF